MKSSKKIIIGILVVVFMIAFAIIVYWEIEKSVTDRTDFDFKVNDNNSIETESHEKKR